MAVHHVGVAYQLLAGKSCEGVRFFKSRLVSESFKSGRGLLPTMNCHVSPLSEPIHDPNKHTVALRNNGGPSCWCGIPITCREELRGGSFFQISPRFREFQEWQGTPSHDELSCITLVRAHP